MYDIIPGVLEKTWQEIEKKLEIIKTFSKTAHVDIIDGEFSNNLTFLDPKPFIKYSKDLILEAHFMVGEPASYLDNFSGAGFTRFIGHIEKMSDQADFVAKGIVLGEVGLALDLDTPINSIKVPIEDLDVILILAVKAGFSNQEFQDAAIDKIKQLREKSNVPIEVDGGINDETIIKAYGAGANRFVSTSFIYNGNPNQNFLKLKRIIEKKG